MKFLKRNENSIFNNKLIAEIANLYEINEDIVKIIISKGYTNKKDIIGFLEPQNFRFHNPFLLKGMEQAVASIKQAIRLKKRITVLGDYDTDGICSTAIMYHYFKSVNVNINYFLPNRFVDGYGLTMDTIDKINKEFQPELLITVDCGISSYKEIEYAKSLGIEVIVTDHHEIPEIVPNCVVIDPKQADQNYPFTELCGAGVALKLVHALAGFKQASEYMSIAAFATVADIVPLVNENRAIVYFGLQTYKTKLPKGVLKLLEHLKISQMQTSDISLRVAPKINTAGRMGDANLAFRLFVEDDMPSINKRIMELDALNEVRVSDGAEIYEEALAMLAHENVSSLKAIILWKDSWNGGVLGIVCAKLVEKFHKPVCLLSKVENEFKGSVRSIEKIDIYKELSSVSDLLIRFGGHSQAGGLSIAEENLEEFKRRFNQNLNDGFEDNHFEVVKYYDLDLNKIELNSKFLNELKLLEPFGFGNEKPIFKLSFNNAKIMRMKNHGKHLKIKINQLDLVAWNLGKHLDHLKTNSNKDILLELNGEYAYNGQTYVNAVLKALKIHKLNTNVKQELVNSSVVNQLQFLNQTVETKVTRCSTGEMEEVLKNTLVASSFGTLVVTNSFENYNNFLNNFGAFVVNHELFEMQSKTGENCILYLPNFAEPLSGYGNVILLEPVICEGVLSQFHANNIYVAQNGFQSVLKNLQNITCDRNVFGHIHFAIKNMQQQKLFGENEADYFAKMLKLNPQLKNLKLDQFVFVRLVLHQLGIISLELDDFYAITTNENSKNPLTNSSIYNYVLNLKNQ